MPRRFLFTAISALLSAQVLTAGLSQNTSRDTGTPFRTVRGAVVAGNTDATPLRRVRVVVTGGTIVASPAYTDDYGRFEILVPATAAYALTFTKAGFAPHVSSPTVAAPASDLRIALAAGAAVVGRVTDQYGDPLVTRVHVRRMADEAGRSAQNGEWAADSDDLGEFRVGSLPAGRFEVRVGAFVILTAGIEGARETATDPEGRYEFAGLPAGSYRVTAAKLGTALTMRGRPAEVMITDRQVLSGINVEMQRPSAVIGTVVDHFGEPMEGLTVELWRPVLSDGRRMLRRPEAVPPRRTDDRGRYRLFRATAGEYYVTAGEEARSRRNAVEGPDSSLRVYYPGTSVVAEAVAVRVAAGLDAADIHITHAPPTGGRVYGSAFDSRGSRCDFP
jgi:protocatechuate 3,4-dioxygenase beta subunit